MPVGVVYEWGSHTQGEPVTLDSLSGVPIVTIDAGYETGVVIDDHQLHFVKGAGPPEPPPDDGSSTGRGQMFGHSSVSQMPAMKQAAFGAGHILVLESSGKLYSWGSGWQGQLGLGAKTLETSKPVQIWAFKNKKVVAISCGSHHSAAVTEDGTLYMWGRGFEGQTGHSTKALSDEMNANITGVQLLPKSVGALSRQRIVAVSCGHQFTAAVTALGVVWTWGEGQSGQLGAGRCTQRRVPEPIISNCERHNSDGIFKAVSCGWAHSLAVCACHCLYVWGFNNFGQLGLGDTRTRFKPKRVTVPDLEHDLQKPFKVVKAVASGNISMATQADTGELFTWGFGQDGRLGHGMGEDSAPERPSTQQDEGSRLSASLSRLSRASSVQTNDSELEGPPPPIILHQLEPVQVKALEGKKVNEFSVYKGGALAFVASACYTISPFMGPISGGTNLTITGGGFWDSPDIVVRFSPSRPATPDGTTTAVPRSAIGKYQGIDPVNKQQVITCRAPKFATTGEVIVELAVNGKDFTQSGRTYTYYAVPELSGMEPTSADVREQAEVRIDGAEIFDTGLVKVKFKLKDGADSEYIVDGKVITQSLGFHLNEETEEEEEVFETFITAMAPQIKVDTPMEAKVSVALNGTSFVNVPNVDFIFHRATLNDIFPPSIPVNTEGRVEFHGIDFFDKGGGVMATFSLPSQGASLDEEDYEDPEPIPVTLESTEKAWCVVPNLDLGISSYSKCSVEFSLDDFKSVLGTKMLILYKNPKFRFTGPICGPVNAATQIGISPESRVFRSQNIKVRFLIKGHLDVEIPANIGDSRSQSQLEKPKTAGALDTSSAENTLAEMKAAGMQGRTRTASDLQSLRSTGRGQVSITFPAPPFDWGVPDDDETQISTPSSRPGSKASRGSMRSKSKASLKIPEPAEEKEEKKDDDAIPPDAMIVTAQIFVAFNGVNYSPHFLEYNYYKDPKIKSVDPAQGSKDGGEIRLSGLGFFASDEILVRFKSSPGKKGECTGVHELPGTYEEASKTIVCTLPALPKDEFASPLHIDLNMNGKLYTGKPFDWPYK